MEEQVKRIIKIIIFALPNKYYKMAATEIAERFCDTIYKNQEDIDKHPREEIIEIVKNYLTKHLNAEDTKEQKQLIFKTILDKMANPFQTIFKSENVNLLLVNKYLEKDDVLKEVILESVAKLKKLQEEGEEKDKGEEGEEGEEEDEKVKLPYKTKSVGQSPISNLIVGDITGVELPYKTDSVNQSNEENNNENKEKKGGGDMLAKVGNLSNSASALMSAAKTGVDRLASVTNTPFAASISAGPGFGPSDDSGSGSHHSQCCPLLDDNLLGMLKGIFTVDLLKGFYKEGAQLTVDKINEQLSDVTKEPAVVKQEIYDKILEVFRAHLTSEEGRKMIFEYIDTIMKANINQLTEEKEIAKQGFISILKHGSPEIKDIFESALDRALAKQSINDLGEVNETNIGTITESMKAEIKEFIIDKYKGNTGKDISAEPVSGIVESSAHVQDKKPVENPVENPVEKPGENPVATLDTTSVATPVEKPVENPVATLDTTSVATLDTTSVATPVEKPVENPVATLDAKQDATPVAQADATEVVKQDATLVTQADAKSAATLDTTSDATPVEKPVAQADATAEVVKQDNQQDSNKQDKISGGAKKAKRYIKKQKRFTKKQKRFTKKQKRSQSKKRRQTKRRVNKSGRVRIHK
jgi:hypothetical protein